MRQETKKQDSSGHHTKNALEWIVFGMSCVLVISTMGYLAREAWVGEEGPPKIEVKLGEPVRDLHGARVGVTVINHGNEVASDVQIEIAAKFDEGEQTSSFTIPYLPKNATREGSVSFQEKQPIRSFAGRVAGYAKP